jgi:anti-anti-sigma factor
MTNLNVDKVPSPDGKTLVYRMKGALGETHFAYDLVEEMRQAYQAGTERVVLNLSKLDYITSSGVGIIAAGFTSARRAEKKFFLVGIPKKVRHVLDITGILDVVKHFDTEEQALAA